MKKAKIKMLTTAACLALIGSASAAWVYSGTATASANIGVKVAAYASAGEITVSGADNLCVYFDKGSVAIKKIDETIPFKATYTKPTGFEDSSDKTIKLSYQTVISSKLATYVSFSSAINNTNADGSVQTGFTGDWVSDTEISLTTVPLSLCYNSSNVTSDDLATETTYKEFVAALTGNSTENYDSWYNQSKEWTASEDYYVTINFQAVVTDN